MQSCLKSYPVWAENRNESGPSVEKPTKLDALFQLKTGEDLFNLTFSIHLLLTDLT